MGCGGAVNKGLAMKRKMDSKKKYTEPGQAKSMDYEDSTKLDGADFALLIKAIEESDDVPTIIDKANLKAASEEATCKMKDFLAACTEPDTKTARIMAACLLVPCDPKEKCEEIYKKANGSGDIVKGEELRKVLAAGLTVAVKTIPKLAGVEASYANANVDIDKYVPNWYRDKLYGEIKKETLLAWVDKKCVPEEARDACARAPIGEFRPRQADEKDRVVKQADYAAMASGLMGKKEEKKYDNEFNKKCCDFEKAFGLENIDYAKLVDCAEYYQPKQDGSINEEALKFLFERAEALSVYSSATSNVKEVLGKSLATVNNYATIQIMALLYCKGDASAKFETFVSLCNDRDTMLDFCPGVQVAAGLVMALTICCSAVGDLAVQGNTDLDRIDLPGAIKVWFNGKDEVVPEKIKRDELEKWFVTDGKFAAGEARKIITDFLKANPTYVIQPPAA